LEGVLEIDLSRVLAHMRAGRWNDAHDLVRRTTPHWVPAAPRPAPSGGRSGGWPPASGPTV